MNKFNFLELTNFRQCLSEKFRFKTIFFIKKQWEVRLIECNEKYLSNPIITNHENGWISKTYGCRIKNNNFVWHQIQSFYYNDIFKFAIEFHNDKWVLKNNEEKGVTATDVGEFLEKATRKKG